METATRVHARNLMDFAASRPEIVVLSGDLTSSCEVDTFRDTWPDRFFSMGLTEQNMMSFAGGMAREGFTPYVHTFAVFMYRRALDQIEMSIAYPGLPVRMFGFLPGVTTPGGPTHQAIDDLGVLRALPNMTILETGDATDVESVLDVAQAVDGPVYVRMVRGALPRLFAADQRMKFRTARVLSRGTDLALITSGVATEEALRVTPLLRERGVSLSHLHVTTIKPFDDPAVLEALATAKHGAVVMENHSILGGLGTAVAEVIADHGISGGLTRLGIPDVYMHGASRSYLQAKYGLDAPALVRAVEKRLGTALNISDDQIASVELQTFFGENQLEAL